MATIKELIQRESALGSGHRMCAGCTAPIIVKLVTLAAAKNPLVVGSATGCLEVATTIYPYTAWKCSFIHNAFENVAATMSGVETAYRALKKKGKVKEDFKFIAFGGDGGMYDIGIQSLSGAMERGHSMLAICYDNEAYMNCLSTSSMIMTKDGLKKITEVKEGDEVYAFDQKTYQLVLKKCTGVFDNGTKDVYELSTLHHSIKATSNHPFLTLKRNGRGRKNTFVWKTLAEIKLGDEVIALKNINQEKSAKFNFEKSKKGDYKVNKINEVNIPQKSNPELMKYLGVYVGDGWTRAEKAEVGFALPRNSEERKTLLELHEQIFNRPASRLDEDYVYVNSVNAARFIDSLNFGKGARNKRIPSWVFTLPKEERESFIDGLVLSDGYRTGNSCRYVSASEDLLKTLRLLLQTTGYRVGKVHQQTKPKGTKCVYRELLKDSTYGYVCFSKKEEPNIKKYPSQCRYRNFFVENEYFDTEKVIRIKLVGEEPTLDLRVEDEHNFIADGIVVHNTGIQRSSATPKGADTTTSPAGKVIPGKKEFRKDLTAIMAAHKIPYVAQASPSHWADLVKKVERALSINGPTFMNILMPCMLGWRFNADQGIELAKLAVETCFWPLYEVEDGVRWKVTYTPKEKKPLKEWIGMQGRFRHLNQPGNQHLIDELQAQVDKEWQELLKRSQAG